MPCSIPLMFCAVRLSVLLVCSCVCVSLCVVLVSVTIVLPNLLAPSATPTSPYYGVINALMGAAYTMSPTAANGASITWTTQTPSICATSGAQVTMSQVNFGTCHLTATSALTNTYAPARANTSFPVRQNSGIWGWNDPVPSERYVGSTLQMDASTSSGQPIHYFKYGTGGCTVTTSGLVTFVAARIDTSSATFPNRSDSTAYCEIEAIAPQTERWAQASASKTLSFRFLPTYGPHTRRRTHADATCMHAAPADVVFVPVCPCQ